MSNNIPSPEAFFGHIMGEDRRLERWDRVVEYFNELAKSPCVKMTELGKSTEGNPLLLAVITAPENMRRLDRIREMSQRIAHPRGATPSEIEGIIAESEDESLMDRYLNGEEIEVDTLVADLEKAVARGSFYPVIPVCAETKIGPAWSPVRPTKAASPSDVMRVTAPSGIRPNSGCCVRRWPTRRPASNVPTLVLSEILTPPTEKVARTPMAPPRKSA